MGPEFKGFASKVLASKVLVPRVLASRVLAAIGLVALLSPMSTLQAATKAQDASSGRTEMAQEVIPYVRISSDLPPTEVGLAYLEVVTAKMDEPPMVEIAPDGYSASYRNGADVYKEMSEHGFDDEPMVVVLPESDPAMALPEVVVTASEVTPVYTHITMGNRVIEPVPAGEDQIFIEINTPPLPPGVEAAAPTPDPRKRRFFSQPQIQALDEP